MKTFGWLLTLWQNIALFAIPHRSPFPNFPLLIPFVWLANSCCVCPSSCTSKQYWCVSSVNTSRFFLTGNLGTQSALKGTPTCSSHSDTVSYKTYIASQRNLDVQLSVAMKIEIQRKFSIIFRPRGILKFGFGRDSVLLQIWKWTHRPTYINLKEKVTHIYTNRPDFGQNFDQNYPIFSNFLKFILAQIWETCWKINLFTCQILHKIRGH